MVDLLMVERVTETVGKTEMDDECTMLFNASVVMELTCTDNRVVV